MWKNFVNFPGTRLGRLARAKTNDEMVAQCDKYFPQEQTDCGMPEYFFDHSWIGFNSILDVYRYVPNLDVNENYTYWVCIIFLMGGKCNILLMLYFEMI
jgi:hypothetical protein